jgi:hypothetical protein
MQRAVHFLSRLDRLPHSEADLALELYRDPELLRAVLDAASLPEGAERAAISIDDPVFGPFLIVTRDGHFVTCLGRGMRTGDLPLVTHEALDSVSRKVRRRRHAMLTGTVSAQFRRCARLRRLSVDGALAPSDSGTQSTQLGRRFLGWERDKAMATLAQRRLSGLRAVPVRARSRCSSQEARSNASSCARSAQRHAPTCP